MVKIICNVLLVAFVTGVFSSCDKEEEVIKKSGEVTFAFSALDNSGSRELEDVSVTAVLLSIEDASGNSIYSLEEVELYKLNGQYVSKPLALEEGEYKLTEFMVVNDGKEVKFVSPMAASKKAYLVQASLPISFGVNKDKVEKLAVEVLDIAENSPADFGYSTFFDFSIVKTFDFLLGVFVFDKASDNYELTQANIEVINGGEILYEGEVEAITNQITLRDGYDNYKILIEKEGYHPYEKAFTAETLKLHYDSTDLGPLVITLDTIGEETEVVLQGSEKTQDVSLSSLNPSLNRKNDYPEYLRAVAWTNSGSPTYIRNLIYFDLSEIPEGAKVTSARLSLFNNDDSIAIGGPGHAKISGSNEGILQRVIESWDINTVNWNNQPNTTSADQISLPESNNEFQDYTDIDITTLIQYFVDNPSENYGMLLRLTTEQHYRSLNFCSSDHADTSKHPKLEITFE